jgi:hypothetical protein
MIATVKEEVKKADAWSYVCPNPKTVSFYVLSAA